MKLAVISLCISLLYVQTATPTTLPSDSTTTASPQDRGSLSPQDVARLQSLAEGGDPAAQFRLSQAYEQGNGIPQSDEMAAEWCRKAAMQGNAAAQNQLGLMYLTGEGMARDKQQAVDWYHKAARQGNASAMFNLGAAYYNGDGVNVDDALSYAWFTLAQIAGDAKAGEAVQRADAELKPWEINEAFKRIATLYDQGQYLPQNPAEAARWWLKAANRGDTDAQVEIGIRMALGQGIPPDPVQGRHWCEQVAKERDPRGENCMGYIYRHGSGVKSDPKEARKWYEQSAQQNNALGIKMLAEMDENGEGARPDRTAACVLYARLALAGDRDSLQRLAHLKKQVSSKDWKGVEKQLSMMHADLPKLEEQLGPAESNDNNSLEPAQPR